MRPITCHRCGQIHPFSPCSPERLIPPERLMKLAEAWVCAERAVVDAGLVRPMGVSVDYAAVRKYADAAEAAFRAALAAPGSPASDDITGER